MGGKNEPTEGVRKRTSEKEETGSTAEREGAARDRPRETTTEGVQTDDDGVCRVRERLCDGNGRSGERGVRLKGRRAVWGCGAEREREAEVQKLEREEQRLNATERDSRDCQERRRRQRRRVVVAV